jgi:hypothetical protein
MPPHELEKLARASVAYKYGHKGIDWAFPRWHSNRQQGNDFLKMDENFNGSDWPDWSETEPHYDPDEP